MLSLVGTPTVLRPGGVTREMLESVIGHVDIAHAVLNPLKNGETAASPGMKYKHYAPECDVVIADGGNDCKKTASIACREYTRAELSAKNASYSQRNKTKSRYSGKRHVVIGDRTQPQTLCAALFRELRNESCGMDLIIAESVPAEAQGLAYMNRLLRAARVYGYFRMTAAICRRLSAAFEAVWMPSVFTEFILAQSQKFLIFLKTLRKGFPAHRTGQ